MADYIPAVQVLAAFAVGLFLASGGWWLSLKAVPRRCETCRPARGRHEAPEPILEPSPAEPPERRLRALPPLEDDGREYPRPWFEDDPGAGSPPGTWGP